MSGPLRVLLIGLGPIGKGIAREILSRPRLRLVGAADSAPGVGGRSLGSVLGLDRAGEAVVAKDAAALDGLEADVAVLATTSRFLEQRSLIETLVRRGLAVVSTCEELAYPFHAFPEESRALDSLARERGVAVLGTGINPGFLMDLLPLVLTGACRRVLHLRVERIQDAARRRAPFLKKIGAGLSPEAFDGARHAGELGHVGLEASMRMVAASLGWTLDRVEERITPVVAVSPRATLDGIIEPGRVAGLRQVGRGFAAGAESIRLEFVAAVGQEDPRDAVSLEGDPPVRLVIPGGIPGDQATCSVVANAVPAVARAPAGLRTVADLPPVVCV